jgi:hypothetical protein
MQRTIISVGKWTAALRCEDQNRQFSNLRETARKKMEAWWVRRFIDDSSLSLPLCINMVDRAPPKPMLKPKLVSLDTASWDRNAVVRNATEAQWAVDVQRRVHTVVL